MAPRSRDVLIGDEHEIHISIVPKLGLIIVTQIGDFGEDWFEVDVVQNSRTRLSFDVKTLTGDTKLQAPCRYLIESLHKRLQTSSGHLPEQISSIFKYTVNLGLRTNFLSNRTLMLSLSQALSDTIECSQPSGSTTQVQM